MEKMTIVVPDGQKDFTFLTGNAHSPLPPRKLEKISITGNLSTPAVYVEKNAKFIDETGAVITIDEAAGCIELNMNVFNRHPAVDYPGLIDECRGPGGVVKGILKAHHYLSILPINNGVEMDNLELAELLKMNRFLFSSAADASALIAKLREFKIKIEKDLEASGDNRGAMAAVIKQKVLDNNAPDGFNLCLPIFVGDEPVSISVEIYINPRTFEMQLVSGDLRVKQEMRAGELMAEQIDKLSELLANTPIIHC